MQSPPPSSKRDKSQRHPFASRTSSSSSIPAMRNAWLTVVIIGAIVSLNVVLRHRRRPWKKINNFVSRPDLAAMNNLMVAPVLLATERCVMDRLLRIQSTAPLKAALSRWTSPLSCVHKGLTIDHDCFFFLFF